MSNSNQTIQLANKSLRDAQNIMFRGKKTEAAEIVKQLIEDLSSLKEENPDSPQLKSIEQKVNKLKKDLANRGIQFESVSNKEHPKSGNNTEDSKEASTIEIPKPVKQKLLFAQYAIDRGELKNAEDFVEQAKELMTDKKPSDYNEFTKVEQAIEALKKRKFEEEEQKKKELEAQQKKEKERDVMIEESNVWLNRLNALHYFGSSTSSIIALKEQKEIYNEAFQVFKEFKEANFSFGKSDTLIDKEANLERQIGEFPTIYMKNANQIANMLTENIQNKLDYLNNDKEWISNSNVKPKTVQRRGIKELKNRLDETLSLFEEETNEARNLRFKMAQLEEENNERKTTMAKRTFMESEIPNVALNDLVIEYANEILHKKNEQAKVLSTRIISNWKEKSEWVYTDTTQTSREHRTTKSLNVQIASTQEKNSALLHTLHIEAKLQANNEWSELYGHIMYEDKIAIENVNK